MAQPDSISVSLSPAELAEIKQAIATLRDKLLPSLSAVPPQVKLELPKMGEKTVNFVQKCLEFSQKHPDLAPNFLDVGAFGIDFKAVQDLRDLQTDLAPVIEALDDSLLLSGSEAYQAALMFYGSARNASRQRVPGAARVYDELSSRFPGAPTKKAALAAK